MRFVRLDDTADCAFWISLRHDFSAIRIVYVTRSGQVLITTSTVSTPRGLIVLATLS